MAGAWHAAASSIISLAGAPTVSDVYFFQVSPTVSFRRVSALGGPSTEFRRWEWETAGAPYFDPTGRLLAYTRQRPPGAPATVSEHTIVHEVATGKEQVWPEPHTHVSDWSSDGLSIAGYQHGPRGAQVVTVCRVDETTCRQLTDGSLPKWSPTGDRLYFVRPAATGGSTALWTIGADGTSEQLVLDLGTFRPIDVFFDVSGTGMLTWAPLHAGRQELWTATVK
jgi:dipeptidyl aminopeptidase/acylaminoacyl peptidase